jgi:hypothetical protein
MDVRTGVIVWAALGLAGGVALVAAIPRLGRLAAASWLGVLGAGLLAVEDPLLLFWFALARPSGGAGDAPGWPPVDPQGVAGLVDSQVRAAMFTTAVWGVVGALLVGWVARVALRRGEPWAWRALLVAFLAVAGADVVGALLVFSRGLPLPTPGGAVPGFGWPPIAVGLLAWATALAVSYGPIFGRSAGRAGGERAGHEPAVTATEGAG